MVAIAAALLLLAGVVTAVLMLMAPKHGALVVTVSGPGNKVLDAVEIAVGESKKCDSSPCKITELTAGTHIVKVTAPGYAAIAPKAIKVKAGEEEVLDLTLAAASAGTGVRVTGEGTGLKLFVDGQEVGPLPAEVKDLTPGGHTIKVAGNERYEPLERRVAIEADRIETIGPVKLKVLKGLASIQPGANSDDAKVVLVSGSERRPIPSLPIKIDISTDKSYTLEATKKGFQTFTQPIRFEDGEAEKTFVIDLQSESAEPPVAAAAPAAAPAAPAGGRATPASASKAAALAGIDPGATAAAKPAPAAAAGGGKLNVNSIPVSKVIVDGVPRGQTPQIGLSVPAGPHTVVFIHPEHGRKTSTVNVEAGKTATAVVKFP